MEKLFKRNSSYYYRSKIPKYLQIYFNQKQEYIISLKTNNKNDAKLIVRFLDTKLNYIKSSYMQLSTGQIDKYITEFKQIHFDDILNRNTYLSIEQIDQTIQTLNGSIGVYNAIIENEFYDLMLMLNSKYNIDQVFDLDTDDIELFKKHIVQIKINALSEIKKQIQSKIIQTSQNSQIIDHSNPNTIISIKDAVEEYIVSKTGISDNVLKATKRSLNELIEFCDNKSINDISKLKHKDIIEFRTKLQKLNPIAKPSSLNLTLGSISTFIKYCVKVDYLVKDISKDIKIKLTIKQKLDQKRDTYLDSEIKQLFDNIDLIKYTQKLKKPKKYIDEYELIILIAMYTGSRENEICQLTTDDIKIKDKIIHFDFNVNEDKELKNISSIRKVPVHSTLLPILLPYIKKLKRKNLFTISAGQFSQDYGKFKTQLGFTSKLVFHSFRNTLQNKLKQLKTDNMIINELTGHSHGASEKMTDLYTNKYELAILQEALEKVEYNIE